MYKILTGMIFLIVATSCIAQTWTLQESGTVENLNAVYLLNVNTGWAVGDKGIILKYKDARWSSVQSGTKKKLNDVFFLSDKSGWAVGDSGTILKYDGAQWLSVASPADLDFLKIDFPSDSQGFILADSGYWIGGANKIKFLFSFGSDGWKRENLSSLSGDLTDYSNGYLCTSYNNNYSGQIYHMINGQWVKLPDHEDHEGWWQIKGTNTSSFMVADLMHWSYIYDSTGCIGKGPDLECAWWIKQGNFYYKNYDDSLHEYLNGATSVVHFGNIAATQVTDINFVNDQTGVAVGKGGLIIRYTSNSTTVIRTSRLKAVTPLKKSIVAVSEFQIDQASNRNGEIFDCRGKKMYAGTMISSSVKRALTPGNYICKLK